MGDEFPTLQQKPKMTYRQIEGQQLPVKRAVLPLTVTKVPAEESQGLLGTVHPLLTHRPYSVPEASAVRARGAKAALALTKACSLSTVQSTATLAFLPLRASYRGRIKWAETVVKVHQPEERLQAFDLTWL